MDLDISWHNDAWQKFIKARSQHHFPHALLLSGPQGSGKKIFAQKMIQSLLCTHAENYHACGICPSCKTYKSEANPDYKGVHLEDDKQQISVNQIRALSEFLNYTRSYNGYRVVLIEPLARLNRNAANSLLKSLEEPTDNTVIILISDNINSVLPTIKSRCQRLSLSLPSKLDAIGWLKKQNTTFGTDGTYDEALLLSSGSPLTAIGLPQNLLQDNNTFCSDLLNTLQDSEAITEMAKNWEKYDHETLLNWQITLLQESLKGQIQEPSSVNKNPKRELLLKINRFKPAQQWELYQTLIDHKRYIHTSVNSLIFIENMIMLWLKAKYSQI